MIIQEQSVKRFFGIRATLLLRLALGFAGAILILGLAAPYLNAGAFRGRIQNALQDALGRKVEIEMAHFTLFTGPGFTLENVTIGEDPRYGLEPFAFVPTLQVRVRLDKLLLGQIRLIGLRMIDASLNLVKSDNGTWNAVALVERLGAQGRTPLSFFPAVQMSNARVDIKLGTRKTTLYITETDLSIYPENSGKIYFKFDGSPARTDRAGNGFGHITGTANWYLAPASAAANKLEADVNLEPTNLSELATLVEGQDLGVHGTISAHVLISGPVADLRALGDMQLQDVHRWDLLPAPGNNLHVRFRANVDLRAHTLDLATMPQDSADNPVSLQLRANDFMKHPSWSVLASLHKAPLASLLPLGRRMGMALPAGLQMDGALDGVVGYSSSAGLEGGVVITDAVANIPNVPPLRSASANVTVSAEKVHIEPAILQSDLGGTLRAGGDLNLVTQDMEVNISAERFPATAFKATTNAWFGAPESLALVTDGELSGHFRVSYSPGAKNQGPVWSGQMQFADATMSIPGVATPATNMQGKATFDAVTFDLPRMSGVMAQMPFNGSYRYNANAKHPERINLEFAEADLEQIETALAPTLNDDSLLSHLPFTRRTIPRWLARRSMDGDVLVTRFSIHQVPVGAMSAHFIWQGAAIEVTNMQVALPVGRLEGSGTVALAARLPRYHMTLTVNGYPWGGGFLAVDGSFDTSGMGPLALQHLQAAGKFSGEGVTFSGSDAFNEMSGEFDLAFSGENPVLKLANVEARQDDENWVGTGGNDPEGKVHLDLTSGERRVHLVGDIVSHETASRPPAF